MTNKQLEMVTGPRVMQPTWCRSGMNFLPVIVHTNGTREVLYGDPLANRVTARRYASIEIHKRFARKLGIIG